MVNLKWADYAKWLSCIREGLLPTGLLHLGIKACFSCNYLC